MRFLEACRVVYAVVVICFALDFVNDKRIVVAVEVALTNAAQLFVLLPPLRDLIWAKVSRMVVRSSACFAALSPLRSLESVTWQSCSTGRIVALTAIHFVTFIQGDVEETHLTCEGTK